MTGQHMSGTEHYREAERLVHEATTLCQGPAYVAERAEKLAAAQVHATLALTAATRLPRGPRLLGRRGRHRPRVGGGGVMTCARCTRAIDADGPYVAITMQWERLRRKRITVRHAEDLAYVHEECTEGLAGLVAAAIAGVALILGEKPGAAS